MKREILAPMMFFFFLLKSPAELVGCDDQLYETERGKGSFYMQDNMLEQRKSDVECYVDIYEWEQPLFEYSFSGQWDGSYERDYVYKCCLCAGLSLEGYAALRQIIGIWVQHPVSLYSGEVAPIVECMVSCGAMRIVGCTASDQEPDHWCFEENWERLKYFISAFRSSPRRNTKDD